MDSEAFAPDLSALLQPAAVQAPCGPSVRYEPAFVALRQSREEDDPSLPMGEWERPLKKADWRAVARDASALLVRSKDLQLAAWLCDAWVRLHQVQGLRAGTELLAGLVAQYWDGLHPLIEDGDTDARTAPFVWLNENLPVALRLQVPLVFIADRKPGYLNLADWERVVMPPPSREARGQEAELTREDLIQMVDPRGVRWLTQLQREIAQALEHWDALAKALDEKLAIDAPSLGKVADTLRRMDRACTSLLDGRGAAAPAPPPAPDDFQPPAYLAEPEPGTPHPHEEPAMSADSVSAPAAPGAAIGPIRTRDDAYRMLEAAATFLQRTEPHSPTPYLVKRAVAWGQLSLPDLMEEVLREEGDLGRFFSMLGVNLPRD
jgi:type VI secretion system protein ImpA